MNNIPVLPSDTPLFEWNKSNGNATDRQTMKAYLALITMGAISDFNYLVWNDIVNKVMLCCVNSGEMWDEKYGTYQQTVMDGSSVLTAKMFNAVTYNIERILNNRWKWAVNPNSDGYLGRPRVLGMQYDGDNADEVNGSYFLEIVRVLNVLIQVLKNEANFAEERAFASSKTNTSTYIKSIDVNSMMAKTVFASSKTNTDLITVFDGIANALSVFLSSFTNTDVMIDKWELKEENVLSKSSTGHQLLTLDKLITAHYDLFDNIGTNTVIDMNNGTYINLDLISAGQSLANIDMTYLMTSRLSVISRSMSDTSIKLDRLYNVPPLEAWIDPLRRGNDLYIRSVYHYGKEGAIARLEKEGVFFKYIHTGNNVYIRSTYYKGKQDEDIRLDSGGVYFEPIRKGKNLYIRSDGNIKI